MASIFKQQYIAKNATSKKIRRKNQHWYLEFKDGTGTVERIKGFKDKIATRQLADKLERQASLQEILTLALIRCLRLTPTEQKKTGAANLIVRPISPSKCQT